MLQRILRTKITPPPLNSRILARPRVTDQLLQALDYRLTILHAEAGYGKSTALAELVRAKYVLAWYQLNEEDKDSLTFLLHLCHAFLLALPKLRDLPIDFLETWDGSQGPLPWRGLIDQLINALSVHMEHPTLLVLDDAQTLSHTTEIAEILDRLVNHAPAQLHVVLSGRPRITLPSFSRLLSQGEVLTIDQSALTFSAEEISSLFAQHYNLELSEEEIEALENYTEGWAIALQLIWQSIRSQSSSVVEFPLRWQTSSPDSLFDMLAREVFDRQPDDVRHFLMVTSTLRELQPAACALLWSSAGSTIADSDSLLDYLHSQELFVVETAGGSLRYQNIFHDFLRQQVSSEDSTRWNRMSAEYFLSQDDPGSAMYHLMEAGAWNEVAKLLENFAPRLLASGRLDTLSGYLDILPPESLHQHPILVFMLGELSRLHSRFDEAVGWYHQAEILWRSRGQRDGIARALRGRARVYLDTVDPSQAEQLLEEALFLVDGSEDREAQVRLYELLAENKLNAGRVKEAEELRLKAENLRLEGPSNDELLFRVQLRTGRLAEARQGLRERAAIERQEPVQTPRAHRETLLILSLIDSFMGLGEDAHRAALKGVERGSELDSPFVTAVGHMRQGHALMLLGSAEEREKNYAQALSHFESSVEISHTLKVPRLPVEAYWGLCRVYGYQGDLTNAQSYAQKGIEMAERAGDEWIASLIRLTMGASLMLAARYELAESWLNRAALGFQESSDPFGETATRLWLSQGYLKQRQMVQLERTLPKVLSACLEGHYDFLFIRPTLLGAPDERLFVPLLVAARNHGWQDNYISSLMNELGLQDIAYHPGFQLHVQTLGDFQVWRGSTPIPANGWRRSTARLLFQLLVTYRSKMLDRDQICEHLWPKADRETAWRNFKITLNTLYQVLEPDREPGRESAFVIREGTSYGLRPEADISLDTDQFRRAVRAAQADHSLDALQKVVELYPGEYLPETIYETWAAEERERLAAFFLESADRLAEELLLEGKPSQAVEIAGRVLESDNCWERAYRHLMLAYDRLGDHGQVGRTYQRCVQTLRVELDVPPSKETESLYHTLTMESA